MIYKALSVRQPWANLIAEGRKTIETRQWPTDYRGPLIIVSSKRPPIPPAGCTVAKVNLVDCRPMTKADEEAAGASFYFGAYAWVFEDIQPLIPVPIKGQLGIYEINSDKVMVK